MKETIAYGVQTGQSQLALARNVNLPSREAMLNRAPWVQHFWDSNKELFRNAWLEWEEHELDTLPALDATLIDQSLRKAVEQAWKKPDKESAVKELLQEVSPGVYQFQLFSPYHLTRLRAYLDKAALAGIPTRPPYGIALNRYGMMIDQRSEGYLAAPGFQGFYRALIDRYTRPIARLLFPEILGYDAQSFAFSIQYQPGMDTSLRLHTDASAVTLNININLPGEEFSGSEVDFYDRETGKMNRVSFQPGTAMIHRGSVPHAAQAITSGSRSNLVLWLYGNRMQLPREPKQATELTAHQRWTQSSETLDNYAPF